MRRHLIASLVLLLLPITVYALPPNAGSVHRHYILESAVPLDAAASAELAAQGIEVQKPLANHRYLVRMSDDATPPNDARIRSLSAFDGSRKIARAAYAEAAKGTTSRLRILFQPDVTFEEAQKAIYAAGGTIDTPFALPSLGAQHLTVRVPSMSVTALANDERVFGIYGPPLIPKSLNAVAASISKVTPLFSAPYNLTGTGVVLSIFEPNGPPDVNHFEFGGRVTNHFPAGVAPDRHATHTSGTLVATGVDPRAKGMAPTATLHAFTAFPTLPDGDFDSDTFFLTKRDGPKAAGSVADSNSWDFAFSWQAGNVWFGNEDGYGAYSGLESEPYDAIMRASGEPLTVHAAGNDATAGNPSLTQPWSPHRHIEDQDPVTGVYKHTYCYSQDGTGTDCPAGFGCSPGLTYCEKTKHPTHGADTTVGLMASTKNSVTVGALNPDGLSIASFSSHGPTTDGRVKPELVAKGTAQFSTVLANGYDNLDGTSMATPVVAGMSALLAQQYRKTFGKTPSGSILKTLLIAGADDLGAAGPDYTYGFGLADAKASVDIIIADGGAGSRIRTGTILNGQNVDIPLVLPATPKFRVVLGWFDPEVLLVPANPDDDPLADKTLVNDLDIRITDPTGATVFPYVLNGATPSALATKAANHTDTTEEVEIANAVAGTYHILVHGAIGDPAGAAQDFVVVSNAGTALASCSDSYEPNDTQATAFGNLMSGQTLSAKICNTADVDYFTFISNSLSPLSVSVTATDTPLKVTLSSALSTTVSVTIPAGTSAKLDSVISTLVSPTPNVQFFARVEASGGVGATGAYTLTPSFSFNSTPRKRGAKH
jgi:subtilisin family serine protease